MAIITIFDAHTPNTLRNLLNSRVNVGDANELHCACVVLCDIAAAQAAQIAKLENEVKRLSQTLA